MAIVIWLVMHDVTEIAIQRAGNSFNQCKLQVDSKELLGVVCKALNFLSKTEAFSNFKHMEAEFSLCLCSLNLEQKTNSCH